jgi:hypothetical protein
MSRICKILLAKKQRPAKLAAIFSDLLMKESPASNSPAKFL